MFGVLSLPAGIASLLLALVGAHRAAARLQPRLADRWLRRSLPPDGARLRRALAATPMTVGTAGMPGGDVGATPP